MNKLDREFLKQLQYEMLTQDTVSQADPRFWVIMRTVKEYWVEDDSDGICIYDKDNCENVFEGEIDVELGEWINENFEDIIESYEVVYNSINLKTVDEEEIYIQSEYDLKEFLSDYSIVEYSVCNYRNREEIVPDTMFLTLRECKEHIKANKHHYDKSAHPYAMTAWRSSQVEKLYKIIQETNWDDI